MYLIVGGFIVGFSYYVTGKTGVELNRFLIFLIFGYGFIAMGVIKLLLSLRGRPKKPKVSKASYPQHPSLHQGGHHGHHQGSTTHGMIKYCTQCGAGMRHFDQFCHHCGNRNFRQ